MYFENWNADEEKEMFENSCGRDTLKNQDQYDRHAAIRMWDLLITMTRARADIDSHRDEEARSYKKEGGTNTNDENFDESKLSYKARKHLEAYHEWDNKGKQMLKRFPEVVACVHEVLSQVVE